MKLYRVKLKGMQTAPTGVAYGFSYVVADGTDEAYKKVSNFLEEQDFGFARDRELESVELLADQNQYNNVGNMLFL